MSISQRLHFPIICALCNQYHRGNNAVCAACCEWLPRLGPACQCCATPLAATDYPICGACCIKRPAFDRVHINYRFVEPLRSLIHEFKYQDGLYLSHFLAQLMLKNMPDDWLNTQCLIPVPMHRKRLKLRGYNQASLLAKTLAQQLAKPCQAYICRKILHTPPQASLAVAARAQNVRLAFQAQISPYQHVTLVDDLLTTGSTAQAIATALKQQGVQQVDVWCCAKAILADS